MQSTESRTCNFDECTKAHDSRGYCNGHYQQLKQGRALKPLKRMASRSFTISERLDLYTDKTNHCWLWTGASDEAGYGHLWFGGRARSSHRAAFELLHGPIAPGLLIDHVCHTPACVNPAHLRLVTHKQNGENRAGATANSTSGVLGVYWNQAAQKWHARVRHNKQRVHVGFFATLEDAERAVVAARISLFTHNDRDRVVGVRS